MGSLCAASTIPIVEIGAVPEFFFTDIEIEVFANRCARFVLTCENKPLESEHVETERLVKSRCTTLVEFVPRMIRKTVYALGQQWGRDAMNGLLLPL